MALLCYLSILKKIIIMLIKQIKILLIILCKRWLSCDTEEKTLGIYVLNIGCIIIITIV